MMAASNSEEPQQVLCPNTESSSDLQPNTHQLAVPVNLVAPGVQGFSKVGLTLPADLTFETWRDLGARLRTYDGSLMWWLGDWLQFGEPKYGEKYKAAVEKLGFDYGTAANAKWVAGAFEFSSRDENLSWTHHRAVAGIEDLELRQRLLRQAKENDWSVANLRGEVIKLERDRRQRQIANESGAGRGSWARLYADPPWQYGDARREIGGAEGEYETLPIEKICTFLTDHEIVLHDDAVLFLWATVPMLPEGLAVMKAWGFQYRTEVVWDKVVGNPGSYFLIQTEHLLVGLRGDFPPPSDTSNSNLIRVRSEVHSAKPAAARALIQCLYPAFGKSNSLELFARETADGWTALINGKFV